MQDFIIAMLAISAILIIRDMAKIVFWGRKKNDPVYDCHPQKERMEQYARSLQKLADTFYHMPYRREHLSHSETEGIFEEVREKLCSHCPGQNRCWTLQEALTYKKVYDLLRLIEEDDRDRLLHRQADWYGECINAGKFLEYLREAFQTARQNLIWNNRQTENRLAVAEELNEVASTIEKVAADLYDITTVPGELEQRAEKILRKRHILVRQMWMLQSPEEKFRIFITMRVRSGQCVAVTEIAAILSELCERKMVPARDSRAIVNSENRTVLFVEDTNYKVLYGAARVTKEKETVSGDNYAFTQGEEQFVMCLSDGMGSGLEASRESETVVELLEQFLTTGFSRETSAKLLNSALVLQRRDGMYSTVDICALNLYTGMCEFLKAGAAATFIRRDQWVEAISSSSLAAGLVQQMDFETAAKKIYDGDYLIMVTDGVLDALPEEKEEETMKEIILQIHASKPQEIGRCILEKVMSYCGYRAIDDMTVLVAGVWKK